MDDFLIVLLIVVFIVFIIAVIYIGLVNKLRRLEVMVDEGLSGIDVALTKRFDVLTKMLDTTKAYAKHEAETLIKVISARNKNISSLPISEKEKLATDLDNVQAKINVIAEQYPNLKSDLVFSNLQKSIMDVEEHLQAARRLYNGNVRFLNEAIVSFPTSYIANKKNIKKRDFFTAEANKRDDIKMKFD